MAQIRDAIDKSFKSDRQSVSITPSIIKQSISPLKSGKDEVGPERNRSLFWHLIWLESDKSRSGFVYDVMKRTRHRYHYAIRSCKKEKNHKR